eukprot:CAMPEP_0181206190 /NCGR_PEP_ID=MMETSP1096-20121128/20901_1 /TAXON_ID=156174 ORGANISM="Chrysochromulina ericina, Strain CCMP281" /NCGR_SAMPLE_ID=MMETSP1096 /ASSEMBLY_ACC=CAM_ASM_000453 /LENGTH=290 /DNA_ID=CAMNT_0023297069 /DNA_START=96 /DNA_END=968 /DNA_ORIENTATION=-
MGDDELTPEQKKTIAGNFVKMSPPAQQLKVVEDVRTLIGPDLLSSATEERMLLELNKSQFGAVTLPSGGQVLITPHGELPDGFIDPTSKPPQLLAVNHSKLTCTAKPLSGPHLSELQAVAKYRDPIDAAMRAHASEWLPSAVVTTYGSSSPGVKITCCVAALASDLANYSAGRWWGEWTLTTGGGGVGLLVGQIKCNIHYFEDGNVQLEDTGKYQCELPMGDNIGEAFAKKVMEYEQEWTTKMEDIYRTLSEEVLQSLRRRLPITRTKFDWEKATVAKLAMDLQSQAIKK